MQTLIVPTEQAAKIGNDLHRACQQLRTHLNEAATAAAKQVEKMEKGITVELQWVTGPAQRAAADQIKVQLLVDTALLLGLTQDDVQAAYTHTDGMLWFVTAEEHAAREARRAARAREVTRRTTMTPAETLDRVTKAHALFMAAMEQLDGVYYEPNIGVPLGEAEAAMDELLYSAREDAGLDPEGN